MNTVYTLTDREKDVLSNLDQSDVIATGPWRKGECSLPHRAVIRDLGGKYVVHNQIIGDGARGTAHYASGIYIYAADGVNQLDVALTKFYDRVRKHHNLDTFTRE